MQRCFAAIVLMAFLVALGPGNASADNAQYSAVYEVAPVSSALHVLPPVGENSGDPDDLDPTLLEYLKVSIWEVLGEDNFNQLIDFTSEPAANGLDYIKLQGNQYHVNWDIPKEDIGKEILVHFLVAELTIGYVIYTPEVGRTLPLRFRVDNHPNIRARVLGVQGFSVHEIAAALIEEFDLGAPEIAQVLTDEMYDVMVIAEILRDTFGVTPEEAGAFLSDTEAYTATEIAQVLKDVFDLGGDALRVAQILKDCGFGASQIMDALKQVYGLTLAQIVDILKQVGFTNEELFAALSRPLAEEFAPQLRFDGSAWTFPMSAQDYFDGTIATPGGRLENQDASTLTTPGMEPPTYFKALKAGNQIRIIYWWYYGFQPGCWAPGPGVKGAHDGDWERVMVILSQNLSKVVAVVYWQHAGWFTRLAQGGDSHRFLGTSYDPGLEFYGPHPIVYVGKTQHGSYHNQGGSGDPVSGGGLSYCPYFSDWRNNEGSSYLWLDTQNNLKSLADLEEPWMLEESKATDLALGVGDGTTTAFDLDSKFVKSGSAQVKLDGTVLDQAEWDFSDNTGTDGLDQIVFLTAPAAGVVITADFQRGDFRWGCGPCEDDGIGTHPVQDTNIDTLSTLQTCDGFDATIFGETRGCFESQCEYHDNQSGYTDFHPGTCTHCPSGYIDMGTYCWKNGWPWEWDFTSLKWYGLEFTISQTDKGLSRSQ